MGFRASSAALLFLLGWQASAPPEQTRAARGDVEQCPVQSVEGVDVFDAQGVVDWNAVARSGIQFAFIKATQGTYDTQATFSFNWSQARAFGVLRSAYHFFDPTEDGAAQAGHFLAAVGEMEGDDLPPMLDIECPDGDPNCLYSGASGAASAAEIATRLWAFLDAVEQATGKKPVVYTFGAYLEQNAVSSAGLGIYPLALAFPSDAPCVSPPAPWAQATFWQYSWEGSVDGISGPVDRDRFLGTLGDLQAWAGVSAFRSPSPLPSAPSCGCSWPAARASWAHTYAMQTTDIRKGLKIQIDGVPYAVVDHQFVKPGKGQSFTRCRIKNLQTGAVIERTWKSGESVEVADVETHKLSYSWDEGDSLVFMDTSTGDQVHVMKESVGDEVRFLSEGLDCEVTIYNGNPIGIELPPSVVLQVSESEPGIKGDTASGATKPAKVSTGTVINVPLFIKEGEWVKIDTRTGDYLERVNK
jgi:elongation factor P